MGKLVRRFFGCAAVLGSVVAASGLGGCAVANDGGTGTVDDALDPNAPFLAVSKGTTAAGTQTASARGLDLKALRTLAGADAKAGNEDFYIAINKKELGQRWFLSAYMKQFFPGAVGGGAARSLGTRVVSFRVQNEKLFVFDVDDRKKTSDNFDPDVIVDAYPIVKEFRAFTAKKGSEQFILFDPAQAFAEFGVMSDYFGASGVRYDVDLKYMQRFRNITDGITYEQVFTGLIDVPPDLLGQSEEPPVESNQLRASGTLGIALRRYVEGEGFQPFDMENLRDPKTGAITEHFFTGDPFIRPNTGLYGDYALKWNIKPGMKPIRWVISDQIKVAAAKYKDFDVIGAVKRGIEGWNDVFGFPVFQAEVGTAEDSFADDDTNMLIWDNDPSLSFAFANFRYNPNSSEMRGASVFLNTIWLETAVGDGTPENPGFEDDKPATGALKAPATVSRPPRKKTENRFLTWGGVKEYRACQLEPSAFFEADRIVRNAVANPAPDALLTRKQKVENYLTHVVSHEVGHTLSLRHNFAGSWAGGAGTSVMDYVLDEDSVRAPYALEYDKAALKYLYGLSPDKPAQAFCTDQQTVVDPRCNQFDRGANPLADFYAPRYTGVVAGFLQDPANGAPNQTLNFVLQFVRNPSTSPAANADRLKAWEIATDGIRLPLDPAKVTADPAYAAKADFLMGNVLRRLYLDPQEARGKFFSDPPRTDAAFAQALVAELKASLSAASTIRSPATRRATVDILKKLQTNAALVALKDGRAAVAKEREGADGPLAAELDDLLARIDKALSPYYE